MLPSGANITQNDAAVSIDIDSGKFSFTPNMTEYLCDLVEALENKTKLDELDLNTLQDTYDLMNPDDKFPQNMTVEAQAAILREVFSSNSDIFDQENENNDNRTITINGDNLEFSDKLKEDYAQALSGENTPENREILYKILDSMEALNPENNAGDDLMMKDNYWSMHDLVNDMRIREQVPYEDLVNIVGERINDFENTDIYPEDNKPEFINDYDNDEVYHDEPDIDPVQNRSMPSMKSPLFESKNNSDEEIKFMTDPNKITGTPAPDYESEPEIEVIPREPITGTPAYAKDPEPEIMGEEKEGITGTPAYYEEEPAIEVVELDNPAQITGTPAYEMPDAVAIQKEEANIEAEDDFQLGG